MRRAISRQGVLSGLIASDRWVVAVEEESQQGGPGVK
jgi:hypothetical protein